MINITDDQLISTLEALVEEQPDHVYKVPEHMRAANDEAHRDGRGDYIRCFYVHTDTDGSASPGCLLGHALHRLGMSLDELLPFEGASVYKVLARRTRGVSQDAGEVASAIQDYQDDGHTWGESLRLAKEEMPK